MRETDDWAIVPDVLVPVMGSALPADWTKRMRFSCDAEAITIDNLAWDTPGKFKVRFRLIGPATLECPE